MAAHDNVDIEAFIKAAAERGWSKTQTRKALELSTNKFWAILGVMPPLTWSGRRSSLGVSRSPSPAVTEALARARAARRARHLYTWNGRTGTVAELAAFADASERTIRRRIQHGLTIDQAFSLPATFDWRGLQQIHHQTCLPL
ncbi:hypothetical protein [Pseudomonas juntendi]|jgi:hypothetical protein|uniref:hypothetical protein n=1 Tax=Pseudomonas TaxID=286 RepID=UPI001F362D58|nr:hypothetical protein [Pseudomonas juntendi]MCO7058288.1 hypothetical protein [Pseudomonas juntendi]UJM15260.1 hypothetical protein L1P09_25955 [Pseudomonas juntendi]